LLDSSIQQSPSDPCGKFRVRLETDRQFTKVYHNGVLVYNVNSTAIVTEILRDVSYYIVLEAADGSSVRWPDTGTFKMPKLDASNFELKELNVLGDRSINVIDHEPSSISKQYSLDNVNWVVRGIFNNLTAGSYTVYIRDLYRNVVL